MQSKLSSSKPKIHRFDCLSSTTQYTEQTQYGSDENEKEKERSENAQANDLDI